MLRLMRPFLSHLKGRHRALGALFLLGLCASAASLASPLVGKSFIDAVTERHDYGVVPQIAAALVGLALLDLLLGTAVRLVHARLSADLLAELRQRLFRRCFDGPLDHLEAFRHGDLMTRFGTDIPQVQTLLVDGLLGGVQSILFLLVAAGILLSLSVPMALWSFLGVALALIAATAFRKPVEERTAEIRGIMAELSHFLSERLGALRHIRLHRTEEREGNRFAGLNKRLSDRVVAFQVFDTAASGLPGLTLTLALAWIYLLGGRYLESGAISLGTFVAFVLYQGRLFGPARGLLGLVRSLQEAKVAILRVDEVLGSAPPGAGQRNETEALKPGEIRLRGVGFAYAGKPPVLRGLELAVAPGERVAVFGASGAGKSTLIQLLFGLRQPSEGAAQVGAATGGAPAGYAGSDPFLFHTSLEENLRYACPQATREDCLEAARLAEVDAFASLLPQGYETVIGGRGHALSDGQRQRVGIARLLLQNPQILVFDEAFSGLDPDTEARVRANIRRAFPDRTVLTITHRLGGLADYDRLLLLEDGALRPVNPLELLEYFSQHGEPSAAPFRVGMELPRRSAFADERTPRTLEEERFHG